MAGAMLRGKHWNESQFQGGHGALCGPNALAMLQSALGQSYVNTLTVYNRMLVARRCDPGGASTMANLELQARVDGFSKTVHLGWNDNGYAQATWENFLTTHLLAGAAVLIETNNGQALRDYVSGQGEDATNLQRHFFGVLGYNAGGYSPTIARAVPFGFIATDGCNNSMNPIINGVRTRIMANTSILQFYPATVVGLTRPGALLAIYPKPTGVVVAKPPAPIPAPVPTPIPTPAPVSPTSYTVTVSADELRALESLLTHLPKL